MFMIKPDWNLFKSKFTDNPQESFEWFCYLLFCRQMDCDYIHRYKNQAAVETDPIEKNGEVIGWQAKFYEKTLSNYKNDIIDTIDKVERYYPQITKLQFYTNSEWGQNKGATPAAKKEIEDYAEEKGFKITWMPKSFFESEFVTAQCEGIAKFFFANEESIIDIVQNWKDHTEYLLSKIKHNIIYGGKEIHIHRETELDQLSECANKTIMLKGEGGSGKTALIKEYYDDIIKRNGVLYLIKASELLKNLSNRIVNTDAVSFVEYHSKVNSKVLVIDSAERLHELEENTSFNRFIEYIIDNDWKVVFTVRNSFVEGLNYLLMDVFEEYPKHIEIELINEEELLAIAEEHSFELPVSQRLVSLLQVPFYLNEYLQFYNDSDQLDYDGFKTKLWNGVIKKGSVKRERFFIQLAVHKAENLSFYYQTEDKLAEKLVVENILGQDTCGYFITHDIYEEWALEKHVDVMSMTSENLEIFLASLGSNLSIRRAFRSWISDKIYDKDAIVMNLVELVLRSTRVTAFWKDEIITAVLLSDFSQVHFDSMKPHMLDNEFIILKRISTLLVTSCKELDIEANRMFKDEDSQYTPMLTIPKGNGWESFIKFIYENLDGIRIENIGFSIKVLYEWVSRNKVGVTTKYAGILGLKYYEWLQENHVIIHGKDFEEKILKIIIMSSKEIAEELELVFDQVLVNQWNKHNDPYNSLCDYIIRKTRGILIGKIVPQKLLEILKLYWTVNNEQDTGLFGHTRHDLGVYFGLNDTYQQYYPSSALQTPIYNLLNEDFQNTLDFIIWFANYTTDNYMKSKFASNEVYHAVYVNRDGVEKKIPMSNRLWCVYRGSQTAPDMLESVFMALEKFLLNVGKDTEEDTLCDWLYYILEKTTSSILIGVVSSIACAFPEKTFDIARLLFNDRYFFVFDRNRMILESSPFIGGISRNSLFVKERINSKKIEHRNVDLEMLFGRYMFYYSQVKGEESSKRLEVLCSILDRFYSDVEGENIENTLSWRMSLARMDVRKMKKEEIVVNGQNYLVFDPQIDDAVEEERQKSLNVSNDRQRYLSLKLWTSFRFDNNGDYKKYEEYENNLDNVINDFHELLQDIENNNEDRILLVRGALQYKVSALLYRDFYNELEHEVRQECENILIKGLQEPYAKPYGYQVDDGIRFVYSVIPDMIKHNIELITENQIYLLLSLLDENPIDGVNKFSIYSIKSLEVSIHRGFQEYVLKISNRFLLISKCYEEFLIQRRNQDQGIWSNRDSQYDLFRNFRVVYNDEIRSILTNEENFIINTSAHRVESLSKYFEIISSSEDESLIEMQIILSNHLLNFYYEVEEKRNRNYVDDYFVEKFCDLLLQSDMTTGKLLIEPIITHSLESDLTCDLLRKLIIREDYLKKNDSFWWILNELKDALIKKVNAIQERTGVVTKQYNKILNLLMLNGIPWSEDATKWHSLNDDNLTYFSDIIESLYMNDEVLKGIIRLINGIGSSYFQQGISWISRILELSDGLKDTQVSHDTIINVELAVRKYVNRYRSIIRTVRRSKEELLVILNWLVAFESVVGYFVRDEIL